MTVSRTYDSGLDKPQRAFLRDCVIAELAPLTKENGAYVAAVVPFWHPITGKEDTGELLAELNGKAPAIAVVIGDAEFSPLGSEKTSFKKKASVLAYFLSHNQRGPGYALTGDVRSELDDTKDPGVEVMMEQADQLLVGFQPDDDGAGTIHKLAPVNERHVETDGDFTIWEKSYTVLVETRIDQNRAITQAVELLHSEVSLEDGNVDNNPIAVTETAVNP